MEIKKGYESGWLLSEDGEVLSSLDIPVNFRNKFRALWKFDNLVGAILIEKFNLIHSFGAKSSLDIAFLSKDNRVIRTALIDKNRFIFPVWKSASVVKAPSGSFEDWDLRIGQQVVIKKVSKHSNGKS